jgi:hypothetical protein
LPLSKTALARFVEGMIWSSPRVTKIRFEKNEWSTNMNVNAINGKSAFRAGKHG